jgi:hypothetical protein
MKTLIRFAAVCLLTGVTAHGQTIIADNYNVANVGSGFLLGEGVNSGINPPTTRLAGTAPDSLRYISRTAKDPAGFYIGGNARLRVNSGAQSGRITLSADGTNPFDFAQALGIPWATAANPVEYDISLSMDNNSPVLQRMSFALGTVESSAGDWDFGLQLYRAASGDNFYTVGKRIDVGSSGLGSDQNAAILAMASGSVGSEVSFVIRVTDAGAETSAFNSRVRVSQDGGATWFYDTGSDGTLSGWRLDGASRYFSWDIAANDSFVTYDNFSVTVIQAAVPEPSVLALGLVGGLVGLIWRRRR